MLTSRQKLHRASSRSLHEIKSVLSKIKFPAMSVFIIFMGTLAVFPTVTAEVVRRRCTIKFVISVQKSTAANAVYAHTYFVQVYCFVGFNLFDWLGRVTAGFYRIVCATSDTFPS